MVQNSRVLQNKKMNTQDEATRGFKEVLLKTLFILVPVTIIAVVLCFSGWLAEESFGMTIFWGIFISIIYSLIFTRTLIVASTKK